MIHRAASRRPRSVARTLRALFFLWAALVLAVAVPAPAAGADDPDKTVADVLFAAESLFKSMKDRAHPATWTLLTANSRDTIVREASDALRKAGERERTRDEVRRDFEAGGPLARGYWSGFLEHFDPDAALERSRWEMGAIGSDRAEIRIFSKDAEKPAVVRVYREEGAWKVGLVESFWGRK